jgi:chromosome segregation ATPase
MFAELENVLKKVGSKLETLAEDVAEKVWQKVKAEMDAEEAKGVAGVVGDVVSAGAGFLPPAVGAAVEAATPEVVSCVESLETGKNCTMHGFSHAAPAGMVAGVDVTTP